MTPEVRECGIKLSSTMKDSCMALFGGNISKEVSTVHVDTTGWGEIGGGACTNCFSNDVLTLKSNRLYVKSIRDKSKRWGAGEGGGGGGGQGKLPSHLPQWQLNSIFFLPQGLIAQLV